MSHPSTRSTEEIRQELLSGASQLAGQVRHWAWWRGVVLWLGAILTTLALLLLSDVALRREEVGLRILSLLVLLAAAIWAGYRFLRPVWRLSPTPLQLARWIERSRPELGERLSTAIQIAQTSPAEARFGSRGFRDAVLRAWAAEPQKPNWGAYLDTTSAWRAVGLLALISMLLGAAFVIRPIESRLALGRLLAPWSAHAWPHRDQLAFRNLPGVVGSGSELQLEVIDLNEPLPDEVVIQVRASQDSSPSIRSVATKQLDDLAIGNLPPLEGSIEVRATGGDDDTMPWHRIEVVTPPSLESYQFEIEPPSYAARPPLELVGTRIQVLAGSRVRFVARFDEPVEAIRLALATPPSNAPEETPPEWIPRLSSDSQSLVIGAADGQAAQLTQSVAWRIELKTRDGLRIEQPQRWSIEVVDDTPPTVTFDAPRMNQVAANAQLMLSGQAADDLGLASVTAQLQIEGDESREPLSHAVWSDPGDAPQEVSPQEVSIDSVWDFSTALYSQGVQLQQGQVISVWLEARDHLGQLGRSEVARLEIQSAENLLAKVLERQNELLDRMRELLEAQRRNQRLTERTEQQLRESQQASPAEVDSLSGIAENQSALAEQLAGPRASLLEQVEAIESLLDMNRLSDSPVAEQMRSVEQEIREIAAGQMRQAAQESTAAHRKVQAELSRNGSLDAATLEQLASSSEAQSQAGDALQTLTDRLNRSGGLQQVQREFSTIANRQQSLIHDTEALQLEQLRGGRPESLEAARRGLASEQRALAQQLDALLARARELATGEGNDSTAILEQLEKASETITSGQASSLMRQAAEQVGSEQLASAVDSERQAARVLAQALQKLDPSHPSSQRMDLDNLADALQASSDAVSQLADAQSQLAGQMRQPGASQRSADLAEQQAGLSEQTEQQADQTQTASEPQAADALRMAAAEQQAAEQAARQEQMQPAAEAAQRAAQQLDSLAQNMRQRADELERQARQQQLYRLENALVQMIDQQSPIVASLEALANADSGRDGAAADSSAREADARQVAVDQETVRLNLQEIVLQNQKLLTFAWTLEQTSIDMSRAVASAQRYRIAPEALTAASDALRKLQLARSALEKQQSDPSDTQPQPPEMGEPPPDEAGAEEQPLLPPLASLKLLRGLQDELNQQTRLLEEESDPTRRNRRLRELSDQQQSLGKQLEGLLQERNGEPR